MHNSFFQRETAEFEDWIIDSGKDGQGKKSNPFILLHLNQYSRSSGLLTFTGIAHGQDSG